MIAKTETNGRDASIVATTVNRFASSETTTMVIVVTIILITNCIPDV